METRKRTRPKAALWGKGCLVVLCLVLPAWADWPMFQSNPYHTGRTGNDGVECDSTAWSFTITPPPGWDEDVIWASPVIADTCVYVVARTGGIYCLGLTSGTLVWSTALDDSLASTPVVSKGNLYVLGGPADRKVHCLEASSGEEEWASSPLGSYWHYGPGDRAPWLDSSPVVVGDSVLFVGARDGDLYCLSCSGGSQKWCKHLGNRIESSPAVAGSRVYIGATGHPVSCIDSISRVYCLNTDTGNSHWYYEFHEGNCCGAMGSPTFHAGAANSILIGINECYNANCTGGRLACFRDAYDGDDTNPVAVENAEWYADIYCDVRGTPVVIDTTVYASTGKGLYAFGLVAGEMLIGTNEFIGVQPGGTEELWSSFAASVRFTVAEHETLLYIGNGGCPSGGEPIGTGFYCLNTELETVWSYACDTSSVWASPAIKNGRVIACSNAGTVYCFIDDPNGDGRVVFPAPATRAQNVHTDGGSHAAKRVDPDPRSIRTAVGTEAGEILIELDLAGDETHIVSVSIHDLQGRKLASLIRGQTVNCPLHLRWNGYGSGAPMPSGVYYCKIDVDGRRVTRAIHLIR
jgi:outer membrane protein assembly factor BamB